MRAAAIVLLTTLGMSGCKEPAVDSACVSQTFERDDFIVCGFDAKQQALRLAWASPDGAPYRGFAALSRDVTEARVAFAMNAGMFDATGSPIGLYVEEGQRLHTISTADGPGNFHMKPNGVFWVDASGVPHVASTDAFLAAGATPLWATQSGPMLVIDGVLHPEFSHDGDSRFVRNGVGAGDDGRTWFVISDGPVSFGKLARFFRDELKSVNALYFDGAVSSLWAPSLKRMDVGAQLGPMIVVTSPSPSPH